MAEIKDYYQILQVHHLAEPEVIEGAYKRLVKKYHPDLNAGVNTAAQMREINLAYEILKDPVKRKEYHLRWQQRYAVPVVNREAPPRPAPDPRAVAAQNVLNLYFQAIINRNFAVAYEHISASDKTLISRDDFINWQNEVAKVFALKKFQSTVRQIHQNQVLRGRLYPGIVEFGTITEEQNIVMDRVEKDEFVKKVVLDGGAWKVFLGYEGLQPYIQKFQKLARLITAKTAIHEQFEEQGRIDAATELFNRKGFTERVENELARFQRYGNIFSLIFCEIELTGNCKEESLKKFGRILRANLRQLDVIGRWDEMKLAVLLPETGLAAAIRVAAKMREIARLAKLNYSGTWCAGISFGVVECSAGMEPELFRWADYYLNLAKRNGTNKIVSAQGVL